jgi:hypothetical protein
MIVKNHLLNVKLLSDLRELPSCSSWLNFYPKHMLSAIVMTSIDGMKSSMVFVLPA